MSARGSIQDEAGLLRDLTDRVARLESMTALSGRVGVGALRIGIFVIEINPATDDLQIRRLTDNDTTLLKAN